MTIENINSVQPIINNAADEVKQEEEIKSVPEQKGSSSDVLAVLASLAAIGAAGVAIYKHKSAKKAIEKAEQEAKKKIDAAEEKAKKAAEDVDKKIQEAVDKVKKELKEAGDSKPAPKAPSGDGSKPAPAPAPAPKGTSADTKDKPSVFARFKKLFSRKEKPVSAPKAPEKKESESAAFKPLAPEKPEAKVAEPIEGVTAEDKPSLGQRIKTRIKNLFSKKDKKPRRHQDDAEPNVSAPPSGGAKPKPAAPEGNAAPVSASASTGKPATAEVKPAPAPAAAQKPASATAGEAAEAEHELEETPSFFTRVKNIFKRKSKPSSPSLSLTEEEARIFVKDENRVPNRLEGGILDVELTTKDGRYVQRLREGKNGIIFVPTEPPKFIRKIQNLFKKKAKPIEPIVEPVVSEVKHVSEKLADVTTMTEESLVADYNSLKNVVKDLPAMDPTSQRFLEIQGELFNHRGYRFQNGELVKMVKAEPKVEMTPEIAKYVAEKEAQLNGRISVNVPKKPTNYEHKQLQKEYEEALGVAEKHEPNPSEIFKGIKMPDVTAISDENLLTEYKALKKVVQGLPAADPTSQRFLEIQGELFNHRGYRFQNGELVKMVKAEPKVEMTPEIAKYVAEKEAQLNGRISVNIPKKPTNFEHKQLQKEYEEALSVKQVAKAAPEIKSAAGLVDRSAAEFKGLSEVEALQLEYANCKYCADDLFEFFSGKRKPYQERIVEIEAELKRLGADVNTSQFGEGAMKIRLDVANKRIDVADKIQNLKDYREKFAKISDVIADKGLTGALRTPDEMNVQGDYLWIKSMADKYDFYAKDLEKAIAKVEAKGYKPFEVVTEEDKLIAEYMETYHFKVTSEVNLNYAQKNLSELETKLADELQKKNSPSITKVISAAEEQEQVWKQNARSTVAEKEAELNGNISVNVPQKPTNYQHQQAQKEYDALSIQPQKPRQKTFDDFAAEQEAEWKANARSTVAEKEAELNGNITVNIPQTKDYFERLKMQKEYNQIGRELEEAEWKANASSIVAEKEAELNGNISVNVPKKPTNYQHKQTQKEYDALAVEPAKTAPSPEVQLSEEEAIQRTINSAKKFSGIPVEEPVVQVERQQVRGINELPESFNDEARIYVGKYIRRHGENADRVTEYPKLYPPKKAKAAKKEMARLRKAHIERRVKDYAKHVGCSDETTACTNSYTVLPETKYSYRKYKSMEQERPTEADWQPEMTREEFMQNQEQYRWEEYERTRHLDINDTGKPEKESLFKRIIKKFGF